MATRIDTEWYNFPTGLDIDETAERLNDALDRGRPFFEVEIPFGAGTTRAFINASKVRILVETDQA